MANIKQIKVGSTTYDVEALHFITGSLDTPAQWKAYIDSLVGEGLQIVIDEKSSQGDYPATAPSSDTMGKLYMVALAGQTESGTYTEFVTVQTGTPSNPSYSWEKIGTTAADLSEYAKKGTYTSAGPSSNATGSAGGETVNTSETDLGSALGSAKIDNHTISAHSHTVNAETISIGSASGWSAGSVPTRAAFNYVSGVKASGGTADALTGVKASGTANVNTDAIKDVTLSASSTSADGPAFISSASLGPEKTFAKEGIKEFELTASDTTTAGPAYVQSISGSAPSLGGTKTFVTGYSSFSGGSGGFTPTTKYMKISTSNTTAGDKGTVTLSGGSATGTFNTDAIKSIGGTRNYGFASSPSNVMYAPTVSNEGVLSWSTINASTQDAHTGTAASTGSVSYTAPTLGGTTSFLTTALKSASLSASDTTTDGPKYIQEATHSHTGASLGTADTGTVSISGGSYSATTKYMGHTIEPASTGTVTLSATTKYMKHVNTAAGTTSVVTGVTSDGTATVILSTGLSKEEAYSITGVGSAPSLTITNKTVMTGATLDTAGAATLTHTGTGSVTVPVTVAIGKHKHSVTTSDHTHTLGNHTHNTTLN